MPVRYHLFAVLSILATVLPCDLATPLTRRWDETTVKHSWSAVPEYWESQGHPSAGTTIDLYLALKSHNENTLIDVLYEVSSPRHPRYGAHLSKEQIAELVAPHPDTLTLVNSWLEDHGVPSSSVSTTLGGNWLKVIGVPVSQANDILCASYQLYQHVETNHTVLRTVSYSLPEALRGHIQTVAPTTSFGSPPRTERKERQIRPSGVAAARAEAGSREHVTAPPTFVTPSYLRSLYKTMGYAPAAVNRNALGVAGYNMEYPSLKDLQDFMEEYRTDGEDATFAVVPINNGRYNPSDPGAEASMNIQYAEAMAYPTPHIFYSTGGGFLINNRLPAPGDAYLEWFNYLFDQSNIPPTISISYGTLETQVPLEYAEALCNLYLKLGLRGVSVLVGSGDDGVGRGDCKDGSGNVQFMTIFPASCPWVTSVGGTTRHEPEVASDLSGGGFSLHFPRPIYQDGSVLTYLNRLDKTHAGLYNPDGRGIPDISAQAHSFLFIRNAIPYATDGTSCSTPVVAGVISLLNDYLLSKGEDPLGFLNPFLYGEGLAGLNDITSGSNPACGTHGFPATIGWDPVTGLGTPDFEKLEDIIDAILAFRLREGQKGPL